MAATMESLKEFRLLLGRAARGLDVRDFGSGNIGATNVYRMMGPAAGALTFAMDVGKGAAAVRLARGFGGGLMRHTDAGLKPAALEVLVDQVPAALKAIDQWVVWRWEWKDDHWDKPPRQTDGRLAGERVAGEEVVQ